MRVVRFPFPPSALCGLYHAEVLSSSAAALPSLRFTGRWEPATALLGGLAEVKTQFAKLKGKRQHAGAVSTPVFSRVGAGW